MPSSLHEALVELLRGTPALVLRAARELEALPVEQASLYLDLIMSALSEATRRAVEALMDVDKYEFQSDYLKRLLERGRQQGRGEGREEGREEGLRCAVRAVLHARGLSLTEEQARALDACADPSVLEAWAGRAAVVDDAGAIFLGEATAEREARS